MYHIIERKILNFGKRGRLDTFFFRLDISANFSIAKFQMSMVIGLRIECTRSTRELDTSQTLTPDTMTILSVVLATNCLTARVRCLANFTLPQSIQLYLMPLSSYRAPQILFFNLQRHITCIWMLKLVPYIPTTVFGRVRRNLCC